MRLKAGPRAGDAVTNVTTVTADAAASGPPLAAVSDAQSVTVVEPQVAVTKAHAGPDSVAPGVPVTFTTASQSTPNGGPAVDTDDPTGVSIKVPPHGPGGSVLLEELFCSAAPCSGNGRPPRTTCCSRAARCGSSTRSARSAC